MKIAIDSIIDQHRLLALQALLADPAIYQDGLVTAGTAAADVKQNQQADANHLEVRGALRTLQQLLLQHTVFQSAARPAGFARLMFNRFGPGMAYGLHNDGAVIDGKRTDLSFTLFLSAPDSYDGGELVLHDVSGSATVKLAAGSLMLYPAGCLHEVKSVTRGERLALVGWLQSRVRCPSQREVLFNLESVLAGIAETEDNRNQRLQLQQVRGALLRMWMD